MSKQKKYDFSNISELPLGDTLEVVDRSTGDKKTVKVVDRAEISATVAYLIGVGMEEWKGYYSFNYSHVLNKLEQNKDAKIIRYLCRIRYTFMKYYKEIDTELRNLQNIDRNPRFSGDEVQFLIKQNVDVIRTNSTASDYVSHISILISKYINACQILFPLSIHFEYIKQLFLIADKKGAYIAEYNKYKEYRNFYPFQCYINWEPGDYGFILRDDKVLLDLLYKQNGDHFLIPTS